MKTITKIIQGTLRFALLCTDANNHVVTGISRIGSAAHSVVIVKDSRGRVLWQKCGVGYTAGCALVSPVVLSTTLEEIPVWLYAEPLQNVIPEVWLNANEHRIVPPGFKSADLISEWSVVNDIITVASVGKKQYEAFTASFPQQCITGSISAPHWSLAQLYGASIKTSFVLCKTTDRGTVIGYVADGQLRALCNFWPTAAQLAESPQIQKDLEKLCRSLCGKNQCSSILIYAPQNETGLLLPEVKSFEQLPVPQIAGIPVSHHEPYALALYQNGGPQFAPFDTVAAAKRIESERRSALRLIKNSIIASVCVAAFLSAVGFGIIHYGKGLDKQIAPVQKEIALLDSVRTQTNILTQKWQGRIEALNGRSATTLLLSSLQSVFADGQRLEQMTVRQLDDTHWQADMTGSAGVASGVEECLNRLKSVRNVGDVALQYSERVKDGSAQPFVRFKCSFVWTKGVR